MYINVCGRAVIYKAVCVVEYPEKISFAVAAYPYAKFYGSLTALFGLVLLYRYVPFFSFFFFFFFFFEDLNTLEYGLSVCTGNNPWYYINISRKGWGCKNRFNFNAT